MVIRRIQAPNDSFTPVSPPFAASQVSVGNATAGDLYVYSYDGVTNGIGDPTRYIIVSSGYERVFHFAEYLHAAGWPAMPAFPEPHCGVTTTLLWLKPIVAGTVVLLWF